MPTFQSAGKELAGFARVWQAGNRAFNRVIDVSPKGEDDVYNHMAIKESAPDKEIAVFNKVMGKKYLEIINNAEVHKEAYNAKISLILTLGQEIINA